MKAVCNMVAVSLVAEQLRNGLSVRQSGDAGGLPISRIETIADGTVNPSKVGYAGIDSGERDDWLLHDGDILISHINSVKHLGKCAIYEGMPDRLIHGMNLLGLRCHKDLVYPKYLYYMLSSFGFRRQIPKITKHSVNQSSFSITYFKTLQIPLPPLTEQRRIAAILDKADAIRRKRQAAIDLTEQFLRSVFLDMFGDPVTNPMGWPTHALGDHIEFMTSGSRGWARYYAPSGPRFIRSLDVRMNYISKTDAVFVRPPTGTEAERTRVRPGDVLLTITGSKIGRVAPIPDDIGEAYVSQHVTIIRLNRELRPRFLSMFLSDPRGGQHQIRQVQYGQTKPGLNLDQIRGFRVLCPLLAEQDRFMDIWDRLNRHVEHQTATSWSCDQLFSSLVQRAFRGELPTAEAGLGEQEGQDEEPVSALRERIRAEREAQATKPNARRARKRTQTSVEPTILAQERPLARAMDEGKPGTANPEQVTFFDVARTTTAARQERQSPDGFTTDEVMATFRQACRGRGEMDREELLKEVATRLGFQRLGKSIKDALKGHVRAAIRRKIVGADGDTVWPETNSMDDYTRDELVNTIRSVMQKGCNYDREEVITTVASYLGFSRVRDTIAAPIKSAINAAIRRGILEYDAQLVWRAD